MGERLRPRLSDFIDSNWFILEVDETASFRNGNLMKQKFDETAIC